MTDIPNATTIFPNGPDLERPAVELDMYAWAWNQAGAPQPVLDKIGEAAQAIRAWRGVPGVSAPVDLPWAVTGPDGLAARLADPENARHVARLLSAEREGSWTVTNAAGAVLAGYAGGQQFA
jgi:hypothetical protein